jgi:cell wall-associated NlpC family hydrolase
MAAHLPDIMPATTSQTAELSLSAQQITHESLIAASASARVRFEESSFTAVARAAEKSPPTPTGSRPSRSLSPGALSMPVGSADIVAGLGTPGTGTPRAAVKGAAVLAIAARYVGVPYVYGGTTPAGFDCSGYTKYVYQLLGVSIPRTTDEQLAATSLIPRSQAQPGDLVFFLSGGHAYHEGIYAGDGMMYDAPRTGRSISKRDIFAGDVVYGRIIG